MALYGDVGAEFQRFVKDSLVSLDDSLFSDIPLMEAFLHGTINKCRENGVDNELKCGTFENEDFKYVGFYEIFDNQIKLIPSLVVAKPTCYTKEFVLGVEGNKFCLILFSVE